MDGKLADHFIWFSWKMKEEYLSWVENKKFPYPRPKLDQQNFPNLL